MTTWNIDTPKTEYYDHTSRDLQNFVNEVTAAKLKSIDTETTGLCIWKDIPLYWSLAFGERRATLHASALPYFTDAFNDPTTRWVLARAKYDAHILANVGIELKGQLADVQVMHSLLFCERSHRLKDICQHLFGWRWMDFQDTFGKIGKLQTAEQLIRKAEAHDMSMLAEYAANDAWGTLACYHELKSQLEQAPTHSLFRDIAPYIRTLWDLYEKVEMPYTKVLWFTERNGIQINKAYLDSISPTAVAEIQATEREIYKLAGRAFNPRSPAQLHQYFFEEKKYTAVKFNKVGKTGVRNKSVDSSVLEVWASHDPMAALLLKHREYTKLHGTYIVGLAEHADQFDRIHTTLNQDIARTGRLSSADPNLQNVPGAENDKWKLRGAFVARPGHKLIVADYKQLEMRLLACASLDPDMISVIERGWDIHMGSAAMIFGKPYEDIVAAKKRPHAQLTDYDKECLADRAAAKTIGFGLIYGMGTKKLANSLHCTVKEAQSKIDQFLATYKAVDAFKDEAIKEAMATGYAFTIMGRRRDLPEIASHRNDERSSGERKARNTPIQGSAADVVKMAQINLYKANLHGRYNCIPVLQVHDEIIHECPDEAVPEAMAEIQDWMEHPFVIDLAVALEVDIKAGNSWYEAK
jgi:DNA polymerase-1